MATSEFKPEMETRPFRACAKKNMQYNSYYMVESPKFPRHKENRGREHDGDVRF